MWRSRRTGKDTCFAAAVFIVGAADLGSIDRRIVSARRSKSSHPAVVLVSPDFRLCCPAEGRCFAVFEVGPITGRPLYSITAQASLAPASPLGWLE